MDILSKRKIESELPLSFLLILDGLIVGEVVRKDLSDVCFKLAKVETSRSGRHRASS